MTCGHTILEHYNKQQCFDSTQKAVTGYELSGKREGGASSRRNNNTFMKSIRPGIHDEHLMTLMGYINIHNMTPINIAQPQKITLR